MTTDPVCDSTAIAAELLQSLVTARASPKAVAGGERCDVA